jgi:hypothetical protein
LSNNNNNIDYTKAVLFIMFSVIMSLFLISLTFLPVIKELKLSVMMQERTSILAKQSILESQLKMANLADIKNNNRDELRILRSSFDVQAFNNSVAGFFTNIDLGTFTYEEINRYSDSRFEVVEYSVSGILDEPQTFFDLVDLLNSYKNIIELEFPIEIKALPGFRQEWKFVLKAYRVIEEADAP